MSIFLKSLANALTICVLIFGLKFQITKDNSKNNNKKEGEGCEDMVNENDDFNQFGYNNNFFSNDNLENDFANEENESIIDEIINSCFDNNESDEYDSDNILSNDDSNKKEKNDEKQNKNINQSHNAKKRNKGEKNNIENKTNNGDITIDQYYHTENYSIEDGKIKGKGKNGHKKIVDNELVANEINEEYEILMNCDESDYFIYMKK